MNRLTPFTRSAALVAAVTMFAVPIRAQSFDAARSSPTPTKAVLLSPAAFARLMQPPADSVPAPIAEGPQRPDQLRQALAAMAREARGTTAEPPRRRAAGWGTKTLAVLVVVGAMVGVGLAYYYGGEEPVGITNPPSGR